MRFRDQNKITKVHPQTVSALYKRPKISAMFSETVLDSSITNEREPDAEYLLSSFARLLPIV
jgi:hypothetical protein